MQLHALQKRLEDMADSMIKDGIEHNDKLTLDSGADAKAMVDDYRRFLCVANGMVQLLLDLKHPHFDERRAAILRIIHDEYADDLAKYSAVFIGNLVTDDPKALH